VSSEAGHVQITEFSKEVIPMINWQMEDLFCQYGVAMPYFMLDFDFPDYFQRPDWVSGYNFNLDWGPWGYWLVWFNELLGFLFDEAHLPRWQMPDMSEWSWAMFNDYMSELYDNMQRHYVYGQSGTFTKDEVIEGETSGITGWYKWKDGDGYIHVAKKRDAAGEPVVDFEEEKIVGQTSGAYAWTYEDYWQDYTLSRVAGNNVICRHSDYPYTETTYEEAQANYEDDPTWEIETKGDDLYVRWGASQPYIYYTIWVRNTYISFNTTSISEVQTAQIFLDYVTCPGLDSGSPILYIYKHDFGDTLESGDWTGGTLIAQRTFTTADNLQDVTIDIDPADVTPGGYSRYRFAWKRTVDFDYFAEEDLPAQDLLAADYVKLKLSAT